VCPILLDVLPGVIPQRPLYQRLLLPVLGLVLIALGIIGIILPFVPGLPAFLLGLIFCSCVHQPSEVWMRGKVHAIKARIFPAKKSAGGTKPNELPPPGLPKS
jgi:hypothetical protein